MKKLWFGTFVFLICSFFLLSQAPNNLDSIIIYKGEVAGTGPGLSVIKMALDEVVTVIAKGVDAEGNEVLIAPTWKADKELTIIQVEGKGKTVKIKLKEAPAVAAYFECVKIREDGKKITAGVAVELKK
jgi:hypothetical protein